MRINQPVTSSEYNYSDTTEIISTTNLKGIVTSANADFMQISGFDDDEVINKNHNVVRHPDMPPEAFNMLWSQLKDGKPWVGLVKNRCKNGDYYWVDAYVCPQYEGEEMIGFQSVRTKPKREWVKRADKLYAKVMAGKSEHDKKTSKLDNVSLPKYPMGITGKFFTGFLVAVLPVMAGMWLTGQASLVSALVGLAVSCGLGFAAMRYLLAPILKLAEESRAIHDDILAQYVYTGKTDEVGQIEFGNVFLKAKIRTVVGRIKESSDVLNKSAAEIARGNLDLSQRTEEQASSLEETASSMEEMTATVKQNSDNTQQASTIANGAKEEAESGSEVVAKAVASMAEINDSSKKIADII
ncbi:MAG: PAS domain-containing protein, partial [Gammaproteobacteria bacterium]|nr:PAS domain-containing protein [Gammaproteobacteria bacterium]